PAATIVVQASSWYDLGSRSAMASTLTDHAGRYTVQVPPERAYMLAVLDENYAAPSLINVVAHEDLNRDDLDFTLSAGTVLRGRIVVDSSDRPSRGATVNLVERGGLLPNEFRGAEGLHAQISRATVTTDSEGRYQFRVGPGKYKMIAAMARQPW